MGAGAGVAGERAATRVRLEGHLRQAKRASTTAVAAFRVAGGAPQSIQNGDATVDGQVAGPAVAAVDDGCGGGGGGRGGGGDGSGGRHRDSGCGASVRRRRVAASVDGRPLALGERRAGGGRGRRNERVAKRRSSVAIATTAAARVAAGPRGALHVAVAAASVEAGASPRHAEQAAQFAVDAAVAVREYERRDDGVGAERQDAHLLDVVRQVEVGEQQRRAGHQHQGEGQPAEERHHDDQRRDAGGARLLAVAEHAGVGDAVAQRVDDRARGAPQAAFGRRVMQRLRGAFVAARPWPRRRAPDRQLRRSAGTAVVGVVELDVLADRRRRPANKTIVTIITLVSTKQSYTRIVAEGNAIFIILCVNNTYSRKRNEADKKWRRELIAAPFRVEKNVA